MSGVEKARESLKSARILFEAECYDSCASRCYYAMFQMAVAALIKLGIQQPSRRERYSHDWVQATVSRELIHRRKILPAHMANALPNALELRIRADYRENQLSRKPAERMLKKCEEFMNCLYQEVFANG
ncbi:HEPN domain-containing protein [Candidatus Acetothermia bacterium]|nr:HEPN domain-containing protein [Candidatus Acetothermia bacterium]